MLKKYSEFVLPVLVLLLFITLFRQWFLGGNLSGGDWPYLYPDVIKDIVPFSSWDVLFNYGMGQSSLPRLWFDSYALSVVKLAEFIPWQIFERLMWFFPYIFLSFFSAVVLARKVDLSLNFALLSGVIYSLNTYILMVVSGGQVGVFTAYAFLPFVFYFLLKLFDKTTFKNSLIFSLSLAALIMLDLRVAYMFMFALVIFSTINFIFYPKDLVKKIIFTFILTAGVVILLHFFWILPILLMKQSPTEGLPQIFTSKDSLDFFSFAKFENSASFVHPNWPENIFGKVAFLRPEFLILPLLAFIGLLSIEKTEKKKRLLILSFFLLSVLSIFLAKGTNDPFGEIYRFLFSYVPGFVMFRDPTKWYMLIAVSFAILIPYSLSQISESFNKLNLKVLLPILFLCLWIYLIRDAVLGNISGTFKPREIPNDYVELANKLASDKAFYRTLWVPSQTTLSYVSPTHPAISANDFFNTTSITNLTSRLNKEESIAALQDVSVKYVIIPDDVYGKIFLSDRKYDDRIYKKTLSSLNNNPNLKKVEEYGKIAVFEIPDSENHFWSDDNLNLKVISSSPTKYIVSVENADVGERIIFAESFDRFWEAKIDGNTIPSLRYEVLKNKYINSFVLPSDGSYELEVYYKPQKWVNIGLILSALSLFTLIILIVKLKNK